MTSANRAVRRVEGQRLVYYLSRADTQFWDDHWNRYVSPESYWGAEQGNLGELEEPFTRYLPRRGRILEAGCGLGKHVLALRQRGYAVEGVEWAPATVQAVRTIRPDLPIRIGDVMHLDVPDGYYPAHISLGVVEHRPDGPEPFLREAHRVVAPGGVILVSVPHFHSLRRLKARLAFYREQPEGLQFYQYAFRPREAVGIVERSGFQPMETFNYDVRKGIEDEISLVHQMLRRRTVGYLLRRLIKAWSYGHRHLDHMFLVVGRRL